MNTLTPGTPEEVGFDPARIAAIEARAVEWIDRSSERNDRMPNLSLLVARHGKVVLHKAWGRQTYQPDSPPLTSDHLFALASFSKVFTATAAMMLVDDGILSLNRPVDEYIPELKGEGAERILVHHLLTHTSGFYDGDIMPDFQQVMMGGKPPPQVDDTQSPLMQTMLEIIYKTAPRKKPGEQNVYCSPNILLVAEIVRRLSGMRFAEFVRQRIFEPLGMTSTFLELPESEDHRVAFRSPEEGLPGSTPQMMRHAIGAAGGVSNAYDLAVFCQAFLNGGRYGKARLLSRAAVTEMTRNQIPGVGTVNFDRIFLPEASWGLGWMVQNQSRWKHGHGALQPAGTFYHQGMGGVAAWCDKANDIIGVYMSIAGIRSRETMETDWEFPAFQNMVTAAVTGS